MQSFEALHILAHIDRDLLERRASDLYDYLADSAFDRALNLFHPQAVLELGSDLRAMPFYGRHQGASAIRQAFRHIHIEYEVLRQDLDDVLTDGSRVVVRRSCRLRHRGTGKVCTASFSDWFRFEDGSIAELKTLGDTMALVELVS